MVNVTLPGRNKPLHTVKGKGYCCHSNSAGAKVRLETNVLWRRLKRTAPSPNSTTVKVKLLHNTLQNLVHQAVGQSLLLWGTS